MSIHFKGLVVACLALVASQIANAGVVNGGGGQGVVCRNDAGEVLSASALDLYEAQNYFGLNLIKRPGKTYRDIAKEFAGVLEEGLPQSYPVGTWSSVSGDQVKTGFDVNVGMIFARRASPHFLNEMVNRIDEGKILVGGNNEIPPAQDSHPLLIPKQRGCNVEQIAYYTDSTQRLHVVGNVWTAMSAIDKAGLLAHEAVYRTMRSMGETSSDHSRKLVGYVFAGTKLSWMLKDLPEKFLTCWNETSKFLVYPAGNGYATAQFLIYDGEVVTNKTVGRLYIAPFAQLFGLPKDVPNSGSGLIKTFLSINDPLLNRPNYGITYSVSDNVESFEAFDLVAGQGNNDIHCRDFTEKIVDAPDHSGFIVEPAGP